MELNLLDYIKPELLILVPVLYCVGLALKKAEAVKDKLIPLILGAAGVVLAVVWTIATTLLDNTQAWAMAVFTAVVQGVLCAGASVYCNQIGKQAGKKED